MAFTLVEALIAIVIIGVVAGMTLPTLFTTISEKVKNHRIQVFERKLNKGMALLNVENGVGPYYSSTMEFVEALSKHLKIVNICDSDHLSDCMGYSKFQKRDGTSVNISNMKTSLGLNLYSDDYVDYSSPSVGIVLADGTPMILNYNLKCPVYDPDDVNTQNLSACISGIYDLNGSRGPNRRTKDIISFNAGYGRAFAPTALTYDECMSLKNKLGMKYCCPKATYPNGCGNTDYWAGAVKQCGGVSNMPSIESLISLASRVYRLKNSDGTYSIIKFEPGVVTYAFTEAMHRSKPTAPYYPNVELYAGNGVFKMFGKNSIGFAIWSNTEDRYNPTSTLPPSASALRITFRSDGNMDFPHYKGYSPSPTDGITFGVCIDE